MKWQEVILTIKNEAVDAASNIFFDVGFKGVVIEDPKAVCRYIDEDQWDCHDISPREILDRDMVIIKGYLPKGYESEKSLDIFYKKISQLENYFEDYEADISVGEIKEEDWASSWKKYYKTIKIGKGLVIRPKWEDYAAKSWETVITMDPGAAFGTGTHPTTSLCLRLLEKYLRKGQVVFDVGCGSGILSIASIKLGAKSVFARDIDPMAVKVARRNCLLNGVDNEIKVEAGNFLNEVNERAHLILANLTTDAIVEFTPQAYQKLYGEGILIASGIAAEKAEKAKEEIAATGFELIEQRLEGGWTALAARKKTTKELVG
ncbi:MAG: 50S ribosomal protein L11 methyltransferase [Clostridia bacterium]|nr:50S ribosomal protein L11 methyltransferase [Clostridia bacterium]